MNYCLKRTKLIEVWLLVIYSFKFLGMMIPFIWHENWAIRIQSFQRIFNMIVLIVQFASNTPAVSPSCASSLSLCCTPLYLLFQLEQVKANSNGLNVSQTTLRRTYGIVIIKINSLGVSHLLLACFPHWGQEVIQLWEGKCASTRESSLFSEKLQEWCFQLQKSIDKNLKDSLVHRVISFIEYTITQNCKPL